MPRQGIALVLSAPSGAGKTTLVQRLLRAFPQLGYSVSCTTRQPRQGEVDGKDYIFISREVFEQRRAEGYFAEWAEVHGNLYGTLRSAVEKTLNSGKDLLFDIDVQGAAQLRLSLPHGRFVFVFPPSGQVLERRLRARGTDDEATVLRRLDTARNEIRQAHWFDAWIVNDRLDAAYDELRAVYLNAALAPALRPHLATSLLEGW